jgi:hypothetical protein
MNCVNKKRFINPKLVKEKVMLNFKSTIKKLAPVLSVLFMTAVTLAQSDTGSAVLAGIQIIVSRQPQGF